MQSQYCVQLSSEQTAECQSRDENEEERRGKMKFQNTKLVFIQNSMCRGTSGDMV